MQWTINTVNNISHWSVSPKNARARRENAIWKFSNATSGVAPKTRWLFDNYLTEKSQSAQQLIIESFKKRQCWKLAVSAIALSLWTLNETCFRQIFTAINFVHQELQIYESESLITLHTHGWSQKIQRWKMWLTVCRTSFWIVVQLVEYWVFVLLCLAVAVTDHE